MIRTLIAEPVTLTREGLVALLSREEDIELVATVRRGEGVVPAARVARPDVALLAAAFGDRDGITLARMVSTTVPECSCAVLSASWRPGDLHRAAAAGVRGFLTYDSPAKFLTEAVRRLAAGKEVHDPRLPFST